MLISASALVYQSWWCSETGLATIDVDFAEFAGQIEVKLLDRGSVGHWGRPRDVVDPFW